VLDIQVRYIAGKQCRAEIHYDIDDRKWYIYISCEVEKKVIRGSSFRIPLKPISDREAGIDVGVNNLLAVYVEDGSALLVNGRPLKSISFYWKDNISSYQSMLSRYGFKSSRRLKRMFKRWRKQVKCYIE
jgi:putative transposase